MKKPMKRLCAVVTALSLGISLASDYTQAAVKPKLSKSKLTLSVGGTATLKVKGTTKKVTWSTSNKKIVKVTKKQKPVTTPEATAGTSAPEGTAPTQDPTTPLGTETAPTQKPNTPEETGAAPTQAAAAPTAAATETPATQIPVTAAPTQTPASQDITMVTMPPSTTEEPSNATEETSGLYNAKGTKLYTWAQLLEDQTITVTDGCLTRFDISKCTVETVSLIVDPGVQAIGEDAFVNCDRITAVTLPDTLTSIGNNAFYNCSQLEAIHIPANVQTIGDCAFGYCCGLTSIRIPATVTSIGERAFEMVNNVEYYGSLKDLNDWGSKNINGYVEGQVVYRNAEKEILCGVSSSQLQLTVPNTVEVIEDNAFTNICNLIYQGKLNSDNNWGAIALNGEMVPSEDQ